MSERQAQSTEIREAPDFRPLYAQVKDLIIKRLIAGEWKPGELLPSEFRLAEIFNVSQGTVRKALDEMAAQNLVVRRQGRGTYVAEHSPHRSLFHFFHICDAAGERLLPVSRVLSRDVGPATAQEAARLQLGAGQQVLRLERVRLLNGEPAIVEKIMLPFDLFGDLDLPVGEDLGAELYVLYQQRCDVTIVRADERLSAVAADAREADLLKIAPGAPLLEVDRTAYQLDGRIVEWRVGRIDSRNRYYQATIT
ncbi:GntR family transcriptional regulator [Lacibacterium aquatile]|uniref:GntR family transcriptional regulator n=1 Tax=Lacibacterium aquatile TaxID=1168082 RepID=A0ABW5DV38_9PROT